MTNEARWIIKQKNSPMPENEFKLSNVDFQMFKSTTYVIRKMYSDGCFGFLSENQVYLENHFHRNNIIIYEYLASMFL